MFIQLLEYKTASGLPSENLWEPSDSALRNSLRILGNLPKEYFYHTTLRLDLHFVSTQLKDHVIAQPTYQPSNQLPDQLTNTMPHFGWPSNQLTIHPINQLPDEHNWWSNQPTFRPTNHPGEMDGQPSSRVSQLCALFTGHNLPCEESAEIRKQIWWGSWSGLCSYFVCARILWALLVILACFCTTFNVFCTYFVC